MENIVEICCGSYDDAIKAYEGKAKRIELNSALNLGGLTPSLATLDLVKEDTTLEVVCMVRPRGAGFCYNENDYKVMKRECIDLLKHKADGIAFGFLNEDFTIDEERTKEFVELIKSFNAKSVFHRAFDCVDDVDREVKKLISLGVDRILTSGLKDKAIDGLDTISYLQRNYGDKIEFVVGSGVNYLNANTIIETTLVNQVHTSCKEWVLDKTTSNNEVSYSYFNGEDKYDAVSKELVEKIVNAVR